MVVSGGREQEHLHCYYISKCVRAIMTERVRVRVRARSRIDEIPAKSRLVFDLQAAVNVISTQCIL